MEFLRSALSETFCGMKLRRMSNGRWEGSGGGRDPCARRVKNEPAIEDGREGGLEEEPVSVDKNVDELPGDVGVLWEPKRDMDGGANSP